jgi:3-dehydroquinate synthase
LQEIDSTILFGNTVAILNGWFQTHKYSSIHVLCDDNTFRDCWPKIEKTDWPSPPSVMVIPPREIAKNLQTCETVWDAFISDSADRNSLLINLGGGVVTDLGGFCAASFMRGCKFIHIPTTVLAMTDAAIGGKHGVDFRNYKNYIGTYAEPECIVVDTGFIESLEPGEVKSGLAEIVKHGFLADPELISMIRKPEDPNTTDWELIIRRSIEVKLGFVRGDIYDRGMRAALNFGHTIGHAIETSQLSTGSPLRHGEAVALGMLVEAEISVRLLEMPEKDHAFIEDTIRQLFPDLIFPELTSEALQKLIVKDKKKSGSDVLFSLMKGIGEPVVGQRVSSSMVNEAYLHYNSY